MTLQNPVSQSRRSSVDIADLVMLLVIVIWAGNNVLTKSALEEDVTVRTYVFLRLLIVSTLSFALLAIRRQPLRVDRSDYGRFVVAGVSGFGAYNLLFVMGLSRTSAFSAAILIATAPIFTLLFASALGIERVFPRQWLGVAVAFVGIVIFVGEKLLHGLPASGDLLNLLAAVCFAIYGLTTQDLVRRNGAPLTTAWSALIGFVAIAPFTAGALTDQDWQGMQWRGWTAVLYAAVLSMFVAYTLWSWAIGRSTAGRTVPYLFLIPVFTGLFSVIFLRDDIGVYQLVGAGFALVGVALARRSAGVR
ncbi:MAG: DMT family transporter [Thermomicrobiales bacterium]|nr:DMT family transporter [Thermomicrobiales bacterium]